MKLLSDASYAAMKERTEHLRKRVRSIEVSYQQLVLECGLRGFAVEIKPEVPAQPRRIVLRTQK